MMNYPICILIFLLPLLTSCQQNASKSKVKDTTSVTDTSKSIDEVSNELVKEKDLFSLEEPASKDSLIVVMLKAIREMDVDALESLREDVTDINKLEVAKYWKKSQSDDIKDCFVWLFTDQKRAGISDIMEDALTVSNPDTRTTALCVLLENECDFDSYYKESGALDREKIKAGIARYNEIKKSLK